MWISAKLEWHYTPKHTSWLNQVEIEISVLSRQCLDHRIPRQAELMAEIVTWVAVRNAIKATVDLRFTSRHAPSSPGSIPACWNKSPIAYKLQEVNET